ncbi:MAG: hypothetical protein KJI72_00930 [Patescibacteria group bacterium]|nr:hypothetical protein [Patescibacteria group bacterium]
MRRLFIGVFWVLLFVGISYGGYFGYARWWSGDTGSETRGGAGQFLGSIVDSLENKARERAQAVREAKEETEETAKQYVKQKVAETIFPVGKKIQSFAGSLVNNTPTVVSPQGILTINSITGGESETLPAEASSLFLVPPPPATIITKVGTPLIVSINRVSIYSVDWGDGEREEGESFPDEVRFLSHTWLSKGDYPVSVEVQEEGASEYTYSFPVRVYE